MGERVGGAVEECVRRRNSDEAATFAGQNYLVVDRSVCHEVLGTLYEAAGYT